MPEHEVRQANGRWHRVARRVALVAAKALVLGALPLRWALLARTCLDREVWPLRVVALTFLPAEAFTVLCLIATAIAARRKHLSVLCLAPLAVGAVVYGAVLTASPAVVLEFFRERVAWHLLSWPAFVAGLVGARLVSRRFASATRSLGSLPAIPERSSIASIGIAILGLYALAWTVQSHIGRYVMLGSFHPKYAHVADLVLVACLVSMYVGLGLRRLSGYVFGFVAAGCLLYRSIQIVGAVEIAGLGPITGYKLTGWPYLIAGIIGAVRLWSRFRIQAVRLAAVPGHAELALSTEPIVPPQLVAFLRDLYDASGIPALVRAWNRLLVHGIWRVAKGEKVHTWSQVIFGAQGRAEDLLLDAATFIEGTHVPDVRMRRNNVTPGLVRGLFGVRREFLTVTPMGNARLERFCMYLGARDYGDALDVYWYVVQRPPWWERLLVLLAFVPVLNLFVFPILLLRLVRERRGSLDLDFFDESDLSACVTVAHHCVLDAAKKLMISLNQDPNKLVTTTKGFLGIA